MYANATASHLYTRSSTIPPPHLHTTPLTSFLPWATHSDTNELLHYTATQSANTNDLNDYNMKPNILWPTHYTLFYFFLLIRYK